jgi:hypothetical protein
MRAIKDLADLGDEQFLDQIATGLRYLVEEVDKIDSAAKSLSTPGFAHLINPGADYPATILSVIGEEEAAKVLVLLDAVRCPPSKDKERRRTLGYFYDHVAKAIYAETCQWRPADFAEVMRLIELERPKWYLDGPTGTEWLFYNRNLQQREDALYVGYEREETDESEKREGYWRSPLHSIAGSHLTKNVFAVCRALDQMGVLAREALVVVATIWRQIELCPLTTSADMERWNRSTFEELEKRGLLREVSDSALTIAIDHWPVPLWSIDVGKPKDTESNKLKKALLAQRGTYVEAV